MTTTHTPATLLALHDADPEGLNAMAHELLGWQRVGKPQYAWLRIESGKEVRAWPDELPSYHTSLDAVAELEAGLTDWEKNKYIITLAALCGVNAFSQGSAVVVWKIATAPAHLRLIAWVLTKQTI